MFKNRFDAAAQLCAQIGHYKGVADAVVVAIPRGGVALGAVISEKLNLPLEVILVKKLGYPSNKEFAVGAVGLDGYVLEEDVELPEDYVRNEVQKIQGLLRERRKMYYNGRAPLSLKNKIVIVVDDGVATGRTLMMTLDLIMNESPRRIVVAVPVGPDDTIETLRKYADEVVCLETYTPFYAIGRYYDEFEQVTDEEVIKFLGQRV